MLEASIEMSFFFQTHNLLEMCVIDVSVYTEQSLEYCLNDIQKIWWKWCPCRKLIELKPYRENKGLIHTGKKPIWFQHIPIF